MKIENRREYSVSGKWGKPSSAFYDALMEEDNWKSLLNEAFLISNDDIKNTEEEVTSFASSGCKYPHHVIKNGKLVVHVNGVRAAYARAKQMGIYKGEVKSHIDKHYKECGLTMNHDSIIRENFLMIESVVSEYKESSSIRKKSSIININQEERKMDLMKYFYASLKESKNIMEKNFDFIESVHEMINESKEINDLDWVEEYLMEETESLPKQTDRAESDKNGVRRKKLYIAFIEWAKAYKNNNTFGSVFDKDAFSTIYPFVPHELRYFYRLANPLLCVLPGKLTFFALGELKKINANVNMEEMLIFASTEDEMRVFKVSDKKIYLAKEENGNIKLGNIIGDTFDLYIQKMINKGDILNAPLEEKKPEENVDKEVVNI